MKISLPGVLLRAAEHCETADDESQWATCSLATPLRDLLDHLRQVRAEPARLQEFFECWVDDASPNRKRASDEAHRKD